MDDITYFLREDLNDIGDITTEALFTDETGEGRIIVNNDCVLAGLKDIEQVFMKRGAILHSSYHDGNSIKKFETVATVNGSIRAILSAERLALNILGRMSGIATETKKIVDLCKILNERVEIAATRKTTPGFRKYEKKAVVIGGGVSHRMGLYDTILIKDNHLKLIGSVEKAINKVRQKYKDIPIEIEIENKADAITAAKMNVDIIMLDNIAPRKAKEIISNIKLINPSVSVEISGGITEKNIRSYAPFSDRISLGKLTHTIKNIDFSLEIE
jgi:nicotinate-nucleotide pyrophosphorylase (carboxylating)